MERKRVDEKISYKGMNDRKGMAIADVVFWLIVAFLVLVVMVVAIGIFSGKLTSYVDFMKRIIMGG